MCREEHDFFAVRAVWHTHTTRDGDTVVAQLTSMVLAGSALMCAAAVVADVLGERAGARERVSET